MSNSTATCRFRGHVLQVTRMNTSYPMYSLGMDGWLVGNVSDTGKAIETLSESFRLAFTYDQSVTLPKRFREAVAELAGVSSVPLIPHT